MTDADARPVVAVVATCFHRNSHADVIAGRIATGYHWPPRTGEPTESSIRIGGLYLDQFSGAWEQLRGPDIGRDFAQAHAIPLADTVAGAIQHAHRLARNQGADLAGVLIIGEHGDYPLGEFGQKLYPRPRLFADTTAALAELGVKVPVFIDKHLAPDGDQALAMYRRARELGMPLLAGSSLPLTWRTPSVTDSPSAPVDATVVFWGGIESYLFHALEGAVAFLESAGQPVAGVSRVETQRADATTVAARPDAGAPALLDAALAAAEPSARDVDRARWAAAVDEVFIVHRTDGSILRLVHVAATPDPLQQFAIAVRERNQGEITAFRWELPDPGFDHFTLLVRQIETLVQTGTEPVPVERTLLTSQTLAALMKARATEQAVDTPEIVGGYLP